MSKEIFIAIVQDNPVLYDTRHPDYMCIKLKDQIAKELNYTVFN